MSRGSRELDKWPPASEDYRHVRPYVPENVNDIKIYQGKRYWDPPSDYHNGYRRKMDTHKEKSSNSNSRISRDKSIKKVSTRFAEKTSMQGVAYIYSSKRLIGRLIWIVLLLTAISVMIYHLYFLFDQFFGWPKQTKITLGYSDLMFPAITICNVNVLRKSQLKFASEPLKKLTNELSPTNLMAQRRQNGGDPPEVGDGGGDAPVEEGAGGKRKKRFASGLDNINFTNYDDYDYYVHDYEEGEADEWIAPPEKTQQAEQAFQRMYMRESRENRYKMGHHIKDMLVSCSFDGKSCYPGNFTAFQTAEYGTCFTIESTKMVAKSSGPRNGLVMVMYMENHEYVEGITSGYGARVVIHDRNTFPFPRDEGMYVSTNAETHVGLRMVQISRLGQPYGYCHSGNDFQTKYNTSYSRQGCQVFCQHEKLIESCGCYQQVSDEINKIINRTDVPACSTKSQVICMEKILNSKECVCLNPCIEEDYVLSISSRQWPTKAYANLLKHSVCEKNPEKCDNISGYTDDLDLSLNFLKLAIYYEDLNHEIVSEQADIELPQFLSDVGGALGLWIGLSILSIFEVFQFLIEIANLLIWKCAKSSEEQRRRNDRDIELSNERRNEHHNHEDYQNHGY